MQAYMQIQDYVNRTRSVLQDLIEPYRYADQDIFDALNFVMFEMQRIRPDIFLDLKYQQPQRGSIDDFAPPIYVTTQSYKLKVPVPAKYFQPVTWYMGGYLQIYDVADTQDQRAQAFMTKFNAHMMTLSAA